MNKKTFLSKIFIALFCALVMATPLFVINIPSVFAQEETGPGPCGEGFEEKGPLCVPKSPFNNGGEGSLVNQTTATGLIATVIKILLYFSGIIAVLFLIIGGYYYLTSRGNEEQATKGRQTLVYALLGLSIVILSYVIVTVLTNQLTTNS